MSPTKLALQGTNYIQIKGKSVQTHWSRCFGYLSEGSGHESTPGAAVSDRLQTDLSFHIAFRIDSGTDINSQRQHIDRLSAFISVILPTTQTQQWTGFCKHNYPRILGNVFKA